MARTKKETKEVVLTDAQKTVWDAVKDVAVEYYGLPDNTIGTVAEPQNLDPTTLYIKIKGSAALRTIENALNAFCVKKDKVKVPRFLLKQTDKYIAIVPNPDLV